MVAEQKDSDPDAVNTLRNTRMIRHFDKVKRCDAILVANYEKKVIPEYIGIITLMKMAFAMYWNKKIFILNPTEDPSIQEEVDPMETIYIDGDLAKIV